ncbi:MAG: DUF2069 domain-containing protein [Betaproteobacteria bacterium]|nr:DUF2069 domain-containing protein [Betaproteobacteria bacterium]
MKPTPAARAAHFISTAALILLVVLCIAWEGALAPVRPGGSWLTLKALPLLAPLFGILHGKRYTFQWASMLILAYFAEGAVRAWTDGGMSQRLALLECALAIVFFAAAIAYVRATSVSRTAP